MTDPTPVPDPERPVEPDEVPTEPTEPDPERPILPEEPPTEIVPDPDRPVSMDPDGP
jgi:hypothetical protein